MVQRKKWLVQMTPGSGGHRHPFGQIVVSIEKKLQTFVESSAILANAALYPLVFQIPQ